MTSKTLKNQLLRNYSKDELRMANRLLMHYVAVDIASYDGYKYEKPVIEELSFNESSLDSLDYELKLMLGVDLLEA